MHSKGVSPVVSATLVLLVSILLMTVVYVWAQATISDFTAQLSEETEQQALNLASEITIHSTNTSVVPGQTYYVFIDNSGSTTLHEVAFFFGGAQVGVDTSLTGVAGSI
ncbi:MAG: hypothetical protein GOV15_00890, partial [Candidatus Diapherotrites archaeon]|nr:hypothetical protein [Candidatus Diapherotrites archaeon]